MITSPSAVKECFTTNDIALANRPRLINGKYIGFNYTSISFTSYGDHWRNLRRIMMVEILSSSRLNHFLETRMDETMRLVKKLARDSCKGFTKVELKSKFSEMTFNIIMRMICGKRLLGEDIDVADKEEARKFKAILDELPRLGGANNVGDFLPILRWIDYDNLEKKLKGFSERVDEFLQGMINRHRNASHSADTMVDHLLRLQESHPEYYTDQIIKGLVFVSENNFFVCVFHFIAHSINSSSIYMNKIYNSRNWNWLLVEHCHDNVGHPTCMTIFCFN